MGKIGGKNWEPVNERFILKCQSKKVKDLGMGKEDLK